MNTQHPLEPGPCPIANAVAGEVIERSRKGFAKYGVNAARTDLTELQWLQHLQEELLDAAVYIERLKTDRSRLSDLIGEILATLRVNLLRGHILVDNQAELEKLLDKWALRSRP